MSLLSSHLSAFEGARWFSPRSFMPLYDDSIGRRLRGSAGASCAAKGDQVWSTSAGHTDTASGGILVDKRVCIPALISSSRAAKDKVYGNAKALNLTTTTSHPSSLR